MEKVKISVGEIIIPTYPEPMAEELPMFAENRVHQRTGGNPYPNKVVLRVERSKKENKSYKLVTLENEYVKIEILPEIGGRIYSALDKTTGYDYFYKQHVIKPALIGVLGSWISGGVEFNWPFHHRASGFMACDFKVEELEDGGAVCHLSEHDPIDRMKGMVSIILRPGETSFETRMRLYNRCSVEKSFLWWENAAVPVNESYQIFFPGDVSYVNFHYLKSRITYPIAGGGVFNGIPMEEDRDISWHKNTRQATSYFACASKYDFFGGYDHGKECGVVHIGDHHVSPGKKMFTWAYCQLSKSWERALTDTDGEYAELMAGSYSDNQPNFAWLAPYETKEFSQHWYPISKIGTPTFANLCGAVKIDRERGLVALQSTKIYKSAEVKVLTGESVIFDTVCDLYPENPKFIELSDMKEPVAVKVTAGGRAVIDYREESYDRHNMPDVIEDMPLAADMSDPDELYLAGVHVDQYRDPHTRPDSFWREALRRKPNHIPSLVAMAKYALGNYELCSALDYAKRAERALTVYNTRTQSGELYYTLGRIMEAKGEIDKAYDYYYKAFWAADSVSRAMTRIAVIDIARGDLDEAVRHAECALSYGVNNNLATACLAIAKREQGLLDEAARIIDAQLSRDPLDHLSRFLKGEGNFYKILDSNPVQTCLDIAFDLAAMGRYGYAAQLLSGLESEREDARQKLLYYALGYFKSLLGESAAECYEKAKAAPVGPCYPVRFEEIAVLESATDDEGARMLLGCLCYNKLQYERAARLWESCGDYISKRNLAVAYFSHLGKGGEALDIMRNLLADRPDDEQLLYETVILMNKLGVEPMEKVKLITAHRYTRDDVATELAKAYNQADMPKEALDVLLGRDFVPCEGGEHAIADQYMLAYLILGKKKLDTGAYKEALELFREGQVLPQSLGAGIWNHCKLIPLKYHEALCLTALGNTEAAREIFEYIAGVKIEYFSNMHLKELPYFQAKALVHLGRPTEAQLVTTKYTRLWESIGEKKDNGYFGTTPFFISFVDSPETLRRAQHLYFEGLSHDLKGLDGARERVAHAFEINNDNLLALFFAKYGFLN